MFFGVPRSSSVNVDARGAWSRPVVIGLFPSYRTSRSGPESSVTLESRLLPSYVSVSLFPFRSVMRASLPADVKFQRFPSDQNRLYVESPFFTSFEAE